MIVLWEIDERPVKRRGVWPDPLHSSMEASTEVVQPRKIVIPKGQVVMGSSRVSGTQEELGNSHRKQDCLRKVPP